MTDRDCEGEGFAGLSFTEETFEDCDFTACRSAVLCGGQGTETVQSRRKAAKIIQREFYGTELSVK